MGNEASTGCRDKETQTESKYLMLTEPVPKKRFDKQTQTDLADDDVAGPSRAKRPRLMERDIPHCPVCLEAINNRCPMAPPCGHIMCKACLTRINTVYAAADCPICKQPMGKAFLRIHLN
ncbi:uncharacterized protein LOC111065365 [Drosophila obscura]|uniref:uncharacterized protein LOC111065365 n=1 Tax=Drosophila obscura TaxID=7282 RepID=UPI000B9FDA15|nr:uncharacterized protein LOC111065365 [Drosophila obscura]